jgi:colicin import membrane protein
MTGRERFPLLAMMVGACFLGAEISAADDKAAHALAERFAGGAEKEEAKRTAKRKAEDARRQTAEEAEMLKRARAEAEDRKAAADKARAEEEAREARLEEERRIAEEQRLTEEKRIAEEKRAEEARRVAEEQRLAEEKRIAEQKRAEEARRLAEEQRLAEEKRIAEEKRAEEASRLAEEQRLAEEKRVAEQKRAEEARRVAEEQRLAEEKRIAEERQKRLAAEREAEHTRLTEKLLKLQQQRAERKQLTERAPMGLGAPAAPLIAAPAKPEPPHTDVVTAPASATRVTILLVMDSGTNGIRRFGKKTADPVICSGPTCWVSSGTSRGSLTLARGQALGPANTLGRRAAACNQHLACVFRDVDLKTRAASIQPIDLRIMRHDRRQPLTLEADHSCRVSGGTLVCDKVFATSTWRAWVVPESVAAKAGPAAIEAALESRLGIKPSAALDASRL